MRLKNDAPGNAFGSSMNTVFGCFPYFLVDREFFEISLIRKPAVHSTDSIENSD